MRAMVLHRPGTPLVLEDVPVPAAGSGRLLVPAALGHVGKGGTVVCAGIHMSDLEPLANLRSGELTAAVLR